MKVVKFTHSQFISKLKCTRISFASFMTKYKSHKINTKDIHVSMINPSTLTYEKKISRFFIRYKSLIYRTLFLSLSVLSPDSYFRETLKLPLSLIDIQTINYAELRLTEKRSMIYGILWCTVMWHEGRQLPQHTDSTWMYKVHSSYTKIPLLLFHERIVAMQF